MSDVIPDGDPMLVGPDFTVGEPIPYDEMRRLCGLPDIELLNAMDWARQHTGAPYYRYRDDQLIAERFTIPRATFTSVDVPPYRPGFRHRFHIGVNPPDEPFGPAKIVEETQIFEDDSQWSVVNSRFESLPLPPELQYPRDFTRSALFELLRRTSLWSNPFLPAEFQHWPQPEPDTRTPKERALPRPSTTPPMWAVDAGRQRRTRTNKTKRHR